MGHEPNNLVHIVYPIMVLSNRGVLFFRSEGPMYWYNTIDKYG